MKFTILKPGNRKLAQAKVWSSLKKAFAKLSHGGFEKIFRQIDQLNIKKGVDSMGINKFINQCAILAAGSGAVTGAGGLATMLVGVPVDVVNLITQQFRVTLALSYHHTGKYKITFAEFIKIVAASLKVDTGLSVTKTIVEEVAEKLMISVGSKAAERLVPIVGALIGGTANYLFIKKIAAEIKEKYITTIAI